MPQKTETLKTLLLDTIGTTRIREIVVQMASLNGLKVSERRNLIIPEIKKQRGVTQCIMGTCICSRDVYQ